MKDKHVILTGIHLDSNILVLAIVESDPVWRASMQLQDYCQECACVVLSYVDRFK